MWCDSGLEDDLGASFRRIQAGRQLRRTLGVLPLAEKCSARPFVHRSARVRLKLFLILTCSRCADMRAIWVVVLVLALCAAAPARAWPMWGGGMMSGGGMRWGGRGGMMGCQVRRWRCRTAVGPAQCAACGACVPGGGPRTFYPAFANFWKSSFYHCHLSAAASRLSFAPASSPVCVTPHALHPPYRPLRPRSSLLRSFPALPPPPSPFAGHARG